MVISALLRYGQHSPGKVYKRSSTPPLLNFYCCITSYHQHRGLKPLSFYYVMVSVGSNLTQCGWVLFSGFFTRLKSRCWPTVFSSGGLTEEGSTFKLSWLVDRMHFLEVAELMEACFFKTNKRKSLCFLELLTSRNSWAIF